MHVNLPLVPLVPPSDYEIDFGVAYNKLTSLGATFSLTAYLYPEPVMATKF